jgi:hypothetical protein
MPLGARALASILRRHEPKITNTESGRIGLASMTRGGFPRKWHYTQRLDCVVSLNGEPRRDSCEEEKDEKA